MPVTFAHRGPISRTIRSLIATVTTVVLAATLLTTTAVGVSGAATASPWLATLGTSPQTAAGESAAGIKVAMMELNWSKYETSAGVFNVGYENEMKGRLAALKAAGMKVTLGLGLHYTPAWVKTLPNAKLIDQTGKVSSEANFIFNNTIRQEAEDYLARADAALDFSSFWSIRVSSGSTGQLTYPEGGSYWAFDANAQNGLALPPTMARNPFPGWKPGTAGRTTAELTQWTDWYVGALADTARWQATTVKALGFDGYVEVLTPGVGVYDRKLSTWYAGNLPNGVLGVGAAWGIVYKKLADIPNLVANISTTADGSQGNAGCQATDRAEALNGPNTVWWSSARWISRIADEYGIKKVGGNPGYSTGNATSYKNTGPTGMMATVMNLANTCNYSGIYWAHDDQFYNGTLPLSALTAYGTATAAAPANAPGATPTANPVIPPPTPPITPRLVTDTMFLSTLGTSPVTAADESAAGVKVAMMELNWGNYEPSPGVFNVGYENEMKGRLAALKAAGMKVTLGLGLHFTPAWVKDLPNGRYVDQNGTQSGEANFVFNNNIRKEANDYLARADAALDFSNFWAVRITSGSSSEVMYPSSGSYWAFDANAQNGLALPPTMARNPFPGWKPGTAGRTTAELTQWTDWYVGALADTARWQATTVKALGFDGYVEVLTPGVGVYDRKLSTWYAGNLPNGVLGVGAAWGIVYKKLADIPNLVASITSVGDGSQGNVGCATSDTDEPLDGPNTVWWSSTRWISRIADEYDIPKVGENPGFTASNAAFYRDSGPTGMMATAINLATSCGLSGLYWAHDDQFSNGTLPLTTLTAYTRSSTTAPANAPGASPTANPAVTPPTTPTAPTPVIDSMFLATMSTRPQTAANESAAGVKVAMMELNWSKYETSPGVFSTSYENEMKGRLAALKAAGMKVTLGLGLHYTPAWVKTLPNAKLIDQTGKVSSEANFIFNNTIRQEAEDYLARADAALDFSSFWSIRVSSGSTGQLTYPEGGSYWAFDANAQNGLALPPTMARNPFPGWKPGTAGRTTAELTQWTDWYVGALADTARWQATTVKALGFDGYVEVLTPGVGVYDRKLSTWYAGNLPNGVLGVGAAWGIVYKKLADIPNLVANISTTADGSQGNAGCQATDRAEALNGPNTVWWSSARWISRIADEYGIKKVGGNPGYSTGNATSYKNTGPTGMMATVMNLANTCNYSGIYWAHDDQFYNGTLPLAALTAYGSSTAAAPANAPTS